MSFFTDMFQKAPDYNAYATTLENIRKQKIKNGTQAINQAFGGFDANFYNKRQQAYLDYAMPQIAQQYRDVSAPIGFNLANRNLIGSTVGQKQWSDLNRTMGAAKQQAVDTGIAGSQELQRNIEQQKNLLLGNLYQSADPASAQRAAISTAAGFSYPSTFAPIGNAFASLANTYAMQQGLNAYRPITPIQTLSPYGNLYGAALPPTYQSTNV